MLQFWLNFLGYASTARARQSGQSGAVHHSSRREHQQPRIPHLWSAQLVTGSVTAYDRHGRHHSPGRGLPRDHPRLLQGLGRNHVPGEGVRWHDALVPLGHRHHPGQQPQPRSAVFPRQKCAPTGKYGPQQTTDHNVSDCLSYLSGFTWLLMIFRDAAQTTTEVTFFDFNMSALTALLRRQAEQNPTASYFNVDIIKYQVIVFLSLVFSLSALIFFWVLKIFCIRNGHYY